MRLSRGQQRGSIGSGEESPSCFGGLPSPDTLHPTPHTPHSLQAGQGVPASRLHLLRMQEAHACLRAPPAAGEGGRKRLGGAVRIGGRGIGER